MKLNVYKDNSIVASFEASGYIVRVPTNNSELYVKAMFNRESTRLISALQRGLECGDFCELIGNRCEYDIAMCCGVTEEKLLCTYFGESCIDHSPIFILEDNKLIK